jgi:hypothetical protein
VNGPAATDTDQFIAFCRRVNPGPHVYINTEIAVFETLEAGVKRAEDKPPYRNMVTHLDVVYPETDNESYRSTTPIAFFP